MLDDWSVKFMEVDKYISFSLLYSANFTSQSRKNLFCRKIIPLLVVLARITGFLELKR